MEIQFSCLPISSSELRPLFCFEGATDSVVGLWASAAPVLLLLPLENCRASTSIFIYIEKKLVLPSYKEPTVDALASRTDEGRG